MNVSYIQTRHTCQHDVGGDKSRNMKSVSRHVKVGASAHHARSSASSITHQTKKKKTLGDKNVHQSETETEAERRKAGKLR